MSKRKRRDQRTGSVSKNGKGYLARLCLATGERISLGTYRTREEAERMLLASRAALTSGKQVTPQGITLRKFGEQLLAAWELRDPRNAQRERVRWNLHIVTAPFIDEPLGSIGSKELRAWLKRMMAKPALRGKNAGKALDRQSVTNVRSLLAMIFNEAVEDELLKESPLEGVKVPKDKRAKEDVWTYLDTHEIDMLKDPETSIREDCRCIYLIAIYTGLRQGELWGLRWSDVRTDGPVSYLVVRRSHDATTKNGKTRRIPLFETAVRWFERWKKLAPESQEGWVFPRKDGSQRASGDHAQWFDRRSRRKKGAPITVTPGQKTRAGITRPVRFHDLRHTCASHLLMGTWGRPWSLEEVCEFLGHSDIDITRRYAHLSDSHLQRAALETGRLPKEPDHNPGPKTGSAAEVNQPGTDDSGEAEPMTQEVVTQPAKHGPSGGWHKVGLSSSAGAPESGSKSMKSLEPPTRFELVTYGLRNRGSGVFPAISAA